MAEEIEWEYGLTAPMSWSGQGPMWNSPHIFDDIDDLIIDYMSYMKSNAGTSKFRSRIQVLRRPKPNWEEMDASEWLN